MAPDRPFDAPLTGDPLDILLRHNHWANSRVLVLCREIPPERFHERFGIGPGSLHDTLTHICGAMRRWADRLDGRALRPIIEVPEGSAWTFAAGPKPATPRRTIDELQRLLDDAAEDLLCVAARARERGLATTFSVGFGTKNYTFTLGAALTHVLTHGMHHRAQCLYMLKMAGSPAFRHDAPEIGVVDWQAEIETHQLAAYEPSTESES